MRSLVLSTLLLSAFPLVSMGQVTEGQWTYIVENDGATITASTATGAVTIPSVLGGYAVKKVGNYSPSIFASIFGYDNTSVTSVVIPVSVTSIGDFAFFDCTALTSVTFVLTSSVTSIWNHAFDGCTSLTSITIPNSVISIGNYVFYRCTSLTSITIGNSVTSIGNYVFAYCTSLTSITIPNSVISIGNNAFYGCTSLTSVTIGNSVTSIGRRAFDDCTSLASISVDSANNNFSSAEGVLFNKDKTTLVQYPPSKTGITYTIPSSVTSIGDFAFWGCTYLTSVTIPAIVTSIGGFAFFDCTALTSITIPNSVISIGNNAFYGCTSLVTVYLPAQFADTYTSFGLTASQVNFGMTLTASCDTSKGTILANPNKTPYEAGESVVVTASPNAGYLFSNWSGDSTATTSPITLTMDASKAVTANFIQDGGDNDGDGLTNYQESIAYGTNPNVAETASPVAGLYLATQYTDNYAAGQQNVISDPNSNGLYTATQYTDNYAAGQQNVISDPNFYDLYTANQMQAMAIGELVLTKDANGAFTLNYDIEQSEDLQTWTTYQGYALPLTGLPTDKAFIRIQAK